MASSERLQNEILLKEEAFLKEQRAKLTEQLNKLKVRLLALSRCSVFSRMENCTVAVLFGCYDGNRQKMCDLSSATKHNTLNERSLTETKAKKIIIVERPNSWLFTKCGWELELWSLN